MSAEFNQEFQRSAELVNVWLNSWIRSFDKNSNPAIQKQLQSMEYSIASGGKRFRPVLGFAIGQALGIPSEKLCPWLASVELVHTYSLIHDDLPCMDNDDFRRGKPTNHKVYGEAIALLSGDALLTSAFDIISNEYKSTPEIGLALVRELSVASGVCGMIGGQVMDIESVSSIQNLETIELMHRLKTGAMIAVPIKGVCEIAKTSEIVKSQLQKFGYLLGLAFQIADDILDHEEKDQDQRSYSILLGLDGAKRELEKTSELALSLLREAGCDTWFLKDLVKYNMIRRA